MNRFLASLALLGILAATASACPIVVRSGYVAPYVAPIVKKVVVEKVFEPVAVPIAVFPLAIQVPTYSASFIPPPPAAPVAVQPAPQLAPIAPPVPAVAPAAAIPAAPSVCEKNNQAMLEIVKDLRREIDDLKRQKAGVAPSDPNEPQPLPAVPDPFNPPGPAGLPQPAQPGPAGPQSLAPTLSPALALATAKCARCHQRGREGEGGGMVLLEANGFARLDARGVARLARKVTSGTMPPRDSGLPPLTAAEAALLTDPTLFSSL